MATTLEVICCLLMLCARVSSERGWISTPGTIHHCKGGDVTFEWTHEFEDKISTIYLVNAKTRGVIMMYNLKTGVHTEYPGYEGRTEVLEHSQERTSIVWKNVTKADSVGYILQLGGPGEQSFAHLSVFSVAKFQPTILVDNKPVNESAYVNSSREVIMTVRTNNNFQADINIVSDDVTKECTSSTICSSVIRIDQSKNVSITVAYWICEPLGLNQYFLWKGPAEGPIADSKRAIIIAVVCSITFVVVGVFCLLFVYIMTKRNPSDQWTACHSAYVTCVRKIICEDKTSDAAPNGFHKPNDVVGEKKSVSSIDNKDIDDDENTQPLIDIKSTSNVEDNSAYQPGDAASSDKQSLINSHGLPSNTSKSRPDTSDTQQLSEDLSGGSPPLVDNTENTEQLMSNHATNGERPDPEVTQGTEPALSTVISIPRSTEGLASPVENEFDRQNIIKESKKQRQKERQKKSKFANQKPQTSTKHQHKCDNTVGSTDTLAKSSP